MDTKAKVQLKFGGLETVCVDGRSKKKAQTNDAKPKIL